MNGGITNTVWRLKYVMHMGEVYTQVRQLDFNIFSPYLQ